MGRILALSTRPHRLSELVGQKKVADSIKTMAASGRIPNCYLFSGITGGGKTTIARILAVSFQCTHSEFGEPCDECYKRRDDFQISDINASKYSGVNEIADVVESSNHMPLPPSRKRVFILDEAQRLSSAAQNLLLKYFEDAPVTTIWIICTTEPNKILPTLRRRCVQYALKPLSVDGVEALVRKMRKGVGVKINVPDFSEALCEAGIYSPALVLMALEKHLSGLSIKESVQGIESNVDTLQICRAIVQGDLFKLHSELKKSTVDDTRLIRAAVVGYLNSMLMNKVETAEIVTTGIMQIAEVGRFDENLQMAATNAVLHRLCVRFKKS